MKYVYRIWNYINAVDFQEICFVPSFNVAINFIKAQGEINSLTDEAPSKNYWERKFTYKKYCEQKVWEKKLSSYQEGAVI